VSGMNEKESRPGLLQATGRDYDEWFAALDEWGAAGREYREIAGWLTGEHGFSKWWAQKVIVEYEQSRGLRPPGARPDGTFTAGASKTIATGVERLEAAFADPGLREQWLPGVRLHERTRRPGKSARFDYNDDGTRISVTFAAVADTRSQVGVEHERLPDAGSAQDRKTYWRDRLDALKHLLED
jgi:hypothetical protein